MRKPIASIVLDAGCRELLRIHDRKLKAAGAAQSLLGWSPEVVFGEPGDLVLLGARSLEGLNLRIDPVSKRLVDAGPAPAAVTATR